ncbi:hypothetical protein ACQPYK_45185 [Streptosporangium sp. CA-135522]|uniref:hypothetical protein n=1 Tax=Streptosporangium sp. CA-135522 TaxID=3240072 RepID=UPI003D91009E
MGDQLLDKLLPKTSAAAVYCWTESNTSGTRCRQCCWRDCCGTSCGSFDYC